MDDTRVLRKITTDARARRELLWLRAQEKGDEDTARDLERVDPLIVDRLRAAGLDTGDHVDELPAARSERFARLWHECFDRHAHAYGAPAHER